MRFSLRWMLIGVAIIAAPLAIWANRAHQQHRAVTEILRLGGDVEYGPPAIPVVQFVVGKDYAANVKSVSLIRHGPEDLRVSHVTDYDALVVCLRRFPRLRKVVLLEYNHRGWASGLEELFPNVKIVFSHGGVI